MKAIMDKLGAAVEEYQSKKHPFFRRQIAAAFAVVENGPDASDYVVRIFLSSQGESAEAGKWKAEHYVSRSNDDACNNAVMGCSYSVVDVTDYLCRYYWEQGEPFLV